MRGREKPPPWGRQRSYRHFDERSSESFVERYVEDESCIARHRFWPFISYDQTVKRYDAPSRTTKAKHRPIMYASHLDSHVFAYYSYLLGARYEAKLHATNAADSVLAYRPGIGCNIDHADRAFRLVAQLGNCVAMCLDIEGFFDSLDHQLLKESWSRVLDSPMLPDDHYAVYRAITHFAHVPLDCLLDTLGLPTAATRERTACGRPTRLCSAEDYRVKVRGSRLVMVNSSGHGIPQGSPISALLSNVYMLWFDEFMHKLAKSLCAYYLRYSDDILIICPLEAAADLQDQAKDSVAKLRLQINSQKTEVCVFSSRSTGPIALISGNELSYLGFKFDGRRVLIRDRTLSRYYRRMKRAVRAAGGAAKRGSRRPGGSGRIRRDRLYERYSHLPERRNADVRKLSKNEKPRRTRPPGNFISPYARRAHRTFPCSGIRRQMSRHWLNLHRYIDAEARRRGLAPPSE